MSTEYRRQHDTSIPDSEVLNFEIKCETAKKVNFASQQNSVPLIRDVEVINNTSDDAENVFLETSSDPEFFQPHVWHFDRLDASSTQSPRDKHITLSNEYLHSITESVSSNVSFVLKTSDGEILSKILKRVDVLPRDHWGGSHSMAEVLAAFVMPNESTVQTLLSQTADVLQTKSISIKGYENTDPADVWRIANAVWKVLASFGINYATSPPNFETTGQRVRIARDLLDHRLANCLDISLLFSSVLEACALHPVIVLTKDHALMGCWLVPTQFSTVEIDDPIEIRKAIQLDRLILFEPTLALGKAPSNFSHALSEGTRRIDQDREHEFETLLDIQRARIQGISPISTTTKESAIQSNEVVEIDVPLEEPPQIHVFESSVREHVPQESRIEKWQRQLLNLTSRNKLLSIGSGQIIEIETRNSAELEDVVATGKSLRIDPLPDFEEGPEGRDLTEYIQRVKKRLPDEYVYKALQKRQLVVALPRETLERRLIQIYRSAKSNEQEGGSNTLYLIVGTLLWKKASHEQKRYEAPLIMIPVRLVRAGVTSRMKLELHDDEPRFNSTLVELLRNDFGVNLFIDDPLPTDESGINVRKILEHLRHVVHEIPGFEVTERVILGNFSFNKYLLWKDLVDRTDALRENNVVHHMIDSHSERFDSSIDFPRLERLDAELHPSEVFCPLPADSSQLAAVRAASLGKSFVLIGPPGTGKSQTITNIIAQLLSENKKVLFIAEKAAALSVVYRRLVQCGLGAFCLELHSNKVKKTHVLQQLETAWNQNSQISQNDWLSLTRDLKNQREKLNQFVNELHAVHHNGLSPYRALGISVQYRELDVPSLNWPSIDQHSKGDLDQIRSLCDELQIVLSHFDEEQRIGLNLVSRANWTPSWQDSLLGACRAVIDSSRDYAKNFGESLQMIGIDASNYSNNPTRLLNLLMRLSDQPIPDVKISTLSNLPLLKERVIEAREIFEKFDSIDHQLERCYEPKIYSEFNFNHFFDRLKEMKEVNWFKRKKIGQSLIKRLKHAIQDEGEPDLEKDIPLLAQLSELYEQLSSFNDIQEIFPTKFTTTNVDWNAIESSISSLLEVSRLAFDAAAIQDDKPLIEDAVIRLVSLDLRKSTESIALYDHFKQTSEAVRHIQLSLERFYECVESPINGDLRSAGISAKYILDNDGLLRDWCGWNDRKRKSKSYGIGELVAAAEKGSLGDCDLKRAFEVGYSRWWVRNLFESNEILRSFSGFLHERAIDEFKNLDSEYLSLTKKYVQAKLSGRLSDLEDSRVESELGVLQRELAKNSRHMPVRQLISKMPSSLTSLTPCLLMSPLSVAQYLSADQGVFDVVIVDEASQIPVWDCVGALARAKQTIVVGDPKQLPPTSFFERASGEIQSGLGDVEDLPSILDEMIGSSIPQLSLSWHYRSRHEGLIAYSNYNFYNGSLVTFPAPLADEQALEFIPIDSGVYEKGGKKTNQAEAKAVAKRVHEYLKEWSQIDHDSRPSVGVVTFNSQQQQLIEDLLEAYCQDDSDLEWFFSSERDEPVFVKNLESVQGDERDYILFSITYGPDPTGKISMNFGPLNKVGGERRLNVAITRARQKMLIFSTLQPERIDLSRSSSEGVRHLKHFLAYAKHGARELPRMNLGSVGDIESPFEAAVRDVLVDKGWHVVPQIGVSSFRIDLGVVNPDESGRYLAGIECDGATYHSSATARDRDKIREEILTGLGWNIVRVWSTDWWNDSNRLATQLDEKLRDLLETDRRKRKEEQDLVLLRKSEEEIKLATAEEVQSESSRESTGVSSTRVDPFVPKVEKTDDDKIRDSISSEIADESDGVEPVTTNTEVKKYYYEYLDDEELGNTDPKRFHEPEYTPIIQEMVAKIVEKEGPLRLDLLMQKISRIHGWKRTGRMIRERIAASMENYNIEDDGECQFIWSTKTIPRTIPFRWPLDQKRSVDEIPMQELLGLILEIESAEGMPVSLDKLRARLEISRLTKRTKSRLEYVLKCSQSEKHNA